jgi:dipeptidase E
MDKIIYCIGGGELGKRETYEIDKHLVEMIGKKRPHALFIPTASHDAVSYIDCFSSLYEELGCEVLSLNLYDDPTPKEVDDLLAWADFVYVGGGETSLLVDKWVESGFDKKIKKAYSKGLILAGLSAGSSCWFERYLGLRMGDLKPYWSDGLGLIKGATTPHYDENDRKRFDSDLKGERMVGTAIDNGVALIYNNGKLIGNWKAYGWNANAYLLTFDKKGLLHKKVIA